MSEQPRAAIYVRVSSEQQEDNSSLASQEAACAVYCETHGYAAAAVYRDVHTGSQWRERPGLHRLLIALRPDGVSVVVCYALDRLSRDQTHLGAIVDLLDDAGVRLEFVTENFEQSAVGTFIRSAKAFVAQVEREKIIARTGSGRTARVKAGKRLAGGKPPYGYQWTTVTKEALTPEQSEKVIVRRIFAAAAAGCGPRVIANQLTAGGVPSPIGQARWWHTTVRGVLRNPLYMGENRALRWQAVPTQKPRAGAKRHHSGRIREDAAQIMLAPVEPLVSAATWRAAQATYRPAAPVSDPEAVTLRGHVVCGGCGRAMALYRYVDGRRAYRCAGEAGCLPRRSVAASAADAAAWQTAQRILLNPDLIRVQVEQRAQRDPVRDEIASLDRQLAKARRSQANRAFALGGVDEPDAQAPLLAALKHDAALIRQLEAEKAELLTQRLDWEA